MKSGSAQLTPSAKRAKLRGHGDESAGQSPGEERAPRREHAAKVQGVPFAEAAEYSPAHACELPVGRESHSERSQATDSARCP